MADVIDIDAKAVERLTEKFRDFKDEMVQATEIALFNSSSLIKDYAEVEHIFEPQSRTLQKSIFIDVKKNTSEIFVPIDGSHGVPYAGWIWTGKRETKSGKIAVWKRQPEGDPFIETAMTKHEKEFEKVYKNDLTDEINEIIK